VDIHCQTSAARLTRQKNSGSLNNFPKTHALQGFTGLHDGDIDDKAEKFF